jgi:hypothetical protein
MVEENAKELDGIGGRMDGMKDKQMMFFGDRRRLERRPPNDGKKEEEERVGLDGKGR